MATKVVNFMIDNMVHHLHDEDVDDEHKKVFCFNETETQTRMQEEKTLLADQLDTTISKLGDDLAALTAEVKELEESIDQLDQDVAKATVQRKTEHQEFVDTFAAMDTSIRLIDRAAVKLQRFYNPKMVEAKEKEALAAAGVVGLAQVRTVTDHRAGNAQHSGVDPIVLPDTPVTYEKKESGGVIGLMDQLKTEVSADMKEAEVDEKYAARDYTELMKDSKTTRAADFKSLTTKKSQKAQTEDKLFKAKEQNEMTLQELDQIKIYLRQLDIECTFLMKNFEARHDARVGEEVGLEGAETIVTHEEPPSHKDTEEAFESEHSHKQVQSHFPDETLEDVMGSEAPK